MSGINWGDMSSDESVENVSSPVRRGISLGGQKKGLLQNKEQYQASQRSIRYHFSDSDDEDCSTDIDSCVSVEAVESKEKRENCIEITRNIRQLQKKQGDEDSKRQKPLSKKEKKEQKSKELDDLNNLLDEFGVTHEKPMVDCLNDLDKESFTCKVKSDDMLNPKWSLTDPKPTKKKKKRRNKGGDVISKNGEDSNEESSSTVHVKVAAILKAKTKPRDKRTTENIAATAAKEVKAKKKTVVKTVKKKKKTRDKYAHGAPSR